MRCGSTSMIRALPWMPSVIMPAWEPVKDWAEAPNLLMAMASSAMEIRSPAERSMSISRAGAESVTWPARSRSSSVVSPMAETTTTTSSPAFWASTTRRATRLMPSASATEEPPNFFTTRCLVAAAEAGSVCGCDPGWTSVVGKLIRAPSLDHRGSGPGNQTARRRNFSPQFIAVPPAPLNCDRMADTAGPVSTGHAQCCGPGVDMLTGSAGHAHSWRAGVGIRALCPFPGVGAGHVRRAGWGSSGREWACSVFPRDMLILGGQEWA